MKQILFILSLILCMSLLSFSNLSFLTEKFLQLLEEKLEAYNRNMPQEKLYLHTDKPFYKPGESIWLNAFIINGTDHTPTNISDIVYVELINPKGSVEKLLTLPVKKGNASGDFELDETLAGGLYKIRSYTQWMKNAGEDTFFEKEIQVQKVITPTVLLKLDFEKEAYGPSAKVVAKLNLKNLQNEALAGQLITVQVQLERKEFLQQKAISDKEGLGKVEFTLPATLQSSDGLLTALVEYEGKTESISRSIPIVLNKIDLQFFPEGGEMVEGVTAKVAFKALNEFGKPADIAGVVVNEKGKAVSSFESFHQGMGVFTFTALKNETYKARITKPEGVRGEYALPAALPKGYTLLLDTIQDNHLQVSYHTPVSKEVYLVAQVRGKIYFSQKLSARSGMNSLTVPLKDFPIGIAQLTLFDHNQIARSERLVFVNAHKKLTVEMSASKKQYTPREKVELTIRTMDEDSLPLPANLSLAVVDDKILSFADDKQDNILSSLLISSDLKGEIEEPSFYFNPQEPKARQALDYVLMTHGWRRFSWKQVMENETAIQYLPEKTGTIAGTIINNKTVQPQAATVTLFELGNNKRVAQVKTKPDGSFTFLEVDPTIPVQIFAEVPLVKNHYIHIELDQNIARSYGIEQKKKSQREEWTLIETEISEESVALAKPLAVPVPMEELEVQAISNQNLTLQADVQSLSEVVVVGYATQMRRDITGSVSTIRDEEVYFTPPMAPEQTLQGRVAGVQVMPGTLMPGKSAKVRIRGNSSLTSGEPLYIIDGYPVQSAINYNFSTPGFISADEIKSIEVLKSPVACAMYGSAGTNGVIAITTKKGGYRPDYTAGRQRSLSSLLIKPRSFTAVREFYSPQYEKKDTSSARTDFRSTIYWNPSLQTDANGKATVVFYNSDEVTSFRAIAEGIALNGLVGRTEYEYFTQLPFSIDTKIPPYLTFEDKTDIPLFLKNNTSQTIEGNLHISLPEALQLTQTLDPTIKLMANEARTVYIPCQVLPIAGKGKLQIQFSSPQYNDEIVQEIEVSPKGFPVELSVSDKTLEKSFSFHINEPMKGSIKAELKAYPDILTDLMSGIESILREPYGCFEQTSSSTYPNILVLQYIRETGQLNKEIEERALDYIKKGYKRLAGFETKEHGFEWFGQTPPHEGLTAFGLMEFLEMQQVYNGVSTAMIDRTRQWLLSRKDGNGGFKQNRGSHGFAAASREVNNAYVVYSLSEAGVKSIRKEYEQVYTEAMQSKDPYRMALVALASYNLQELLKGNQMLQELILKVKKTDFQNLAIAPSIVYSQGKSLQAETASLLALAILKSPQPDVLTLQKTIDYLISGRSYGGFGSTQATILGLKALTEYAKFSKRVAAAGSIVLYHQNQQIGSASYEKDSRGKIVIKDFEKYLQAGKQDFRVVFANTKEALPYSMNVSWNSYTPNSSKQCQVDLQTKLSSGNASVGQTIRLSTILKNKVNEGLPMTVALVGIPSGLSPQPWQLKELQEKKLVDFYEIRHNYVVFYFRELAPRAIHRIHLDLKAEIPGTYEAPASTAYLYYTNEFKDWEAGERVEISK